MRRLLAILLLALGMNAAAAELQPFTTDTPAAIRKSFAGRPFIMVLWSTSCTHCADELRMLGRLVRKDAGLPLAIVATDTPDDAQDIRSALRRFGLDRVDTWVFADSVPERLRHAIDPTWRGELPRAYLYDALHRREAHAGALKEAQLKDWLRRHRPAR